MAAEQKKERHAEKNIAEEREGREVLEQGKLGFQSS